MAGMGPPPKDPTQRRRRNAAPEFTQLPSRRDGDAPPWPLPARRVPEQLDPDSEVGDDDEELDLWAELWAKPIAVVWERQACEREVAQYVRWKVKAEAGNLEAGKEARQFADRLGLNPMSLQRLRFRVVVDEVSEHRAEKSAVPARQRLRAVEG